MLVEWSNKCNVEWDRISVVDIQVSDGFQLLELGDSFEAEIVLDPAAITPNDIGVEMVLAKRKADDNWMYIWDRNWDLSPKTNTMLCIRVVPRHPYRGHSVRYPFFPKNKWLPIGVIYPW